MDQFAGIGVRANLIPIFTIFGGEEGEGQEQLPHLFLYFRAGSDGAVKICASSLFQVGRRLGRFKVSLPATW
jgi:hypothetical protein